MNVDQISFFQQKLAYEMDSADLYEAAGKGEPIVVVDGRSAGGLCCNEHIPGAISLPHREINTDSTGYARQVEAVRLLLRRNRLQRLDQDGAETPHTRIPGSRTNRRPRLVETRRLRHPGRASAPGDLARMWLLTQSFKASSATPFTPPNTHRRNIFAGADLRRPARRGVTSTTHVRRHTQQNNSTYRGHPVPNGARAGRGYGPSTPIHTTETPANSCRSGGIFQTTLRRTCPGAPVFKCSATDHLQFVPDRNRPRP